MKNYKEVGLLGGNTVEDAVNELLNYKKRGVLASINFNGHILYSDTVTMDNAYIKITGSTKSDLDKAQEERIKMSEIKDKEYKKQLPDLTLEWINKGKAVLTEDKWEYWEKIVPVRLNDLYHGMELGCCLDIVTILNNKGTLDEAKEKINSQDHLGMGFSLVCSMVKEFCNRGEEFVEYMR